jgi:integrase
MFGHINTPFLSKRLSKSLTWSGAKNQRGSLASLAGHKSITTTQRYITTNDDVKRRAVELV